VRICNQSVHIWTIPISDLKHRLREYKSTLTTPELKRAARLLTDQDRTSFTLARGGLRSILSQYLDMPAKDIPLSYEAHGKPRLSQRVKTTLEFNLSHSGDYALCALTKKNSIGVDIEKIRTADPNHYVRLATRFFSKPEADVLITAPESERTFLFFCGWTRKEAYIKRHGLGLGLPLSDFTVTIDHRKSAQLVDTPWQPNDLQKTRIYDLKTENGYRAAYAIASTRPKRVKYYIEN